ncbi:hypothetical protein V2J09_000710 [Rumex salicifolius]
MVLVRQSRAKDRCYKIIGYPDNWKSKDSRSQGNWKNIERRANVVEMDDNPLEFVDNSVQKSLLDSDTLSMVCQEVAKLMRGNEWSSNSPAFTSVIVVS